MNPADAFTYQRDRVSEPEIEKGGTTMWTPLRRLAVGAVAAVIVGSALTGASQAAPNQRWFGPARPPVLAVYPNVAVQQYAANLAVLGQAYRQVPPYALGYNPYVRNVYYG